MSDWITDLQEARGRGENAVLVTVVSAKGSVPRPPGTRMLVTASGIGGTIGGGQLEHAAIGIARDMLAATGAPAFELRRFPLGASLGQCCGGLVNLLFEAVGADATWVDKLGEMRRDGVAFVVATPSDRTTTGRLVVTAEATSGSLGNAERDASVVRAARSLLVEGGEARILCVDASVVFLDPQRARDFNIVLFGAGHVGRALVEVLGRLSCRVTWVDERESEFPTAIPSNVTVVVTDVPEAEVAAAPTGAHFLVMTHNHALDQTLAEAILRRGDFAYFGLIGSIAKRRQFERRMAARGIPAARFDAMTCPIGVPGIKGKEPATIAVAVAAQLLQARERQQAGERVAYDAVASG